MFCPSVICGIFTRVDNYGRHSKKYIFLISIILPLENFLFTKSSLLASIETIYSALVVDRVVHFCNLDYHGMTLAKVS